MSTAKEITNKLWNMANKLRGTMDASEYKNYILPFMFYRFLSENQDEYIKQNNIEEFYTETESELEDYLVDISMALGYAIDREYTWDKLVKKIENHEIVPEDFQKLFEKFDLNAKRNDFAIEDFTGVFSDVNLGDSRLGGTVNERAKALSDIILMIDEINYKDESGHDILGDVYEYMIGQFAANAGKKAGEFYTPHEASQILARIVTHGKENHDGQFTVYDPTMGSGSLLLTVQKELPGGDKSGSVNFYGQELNTTTYNLARMNLMMHGVNYKNMNLRRADTLDGDWPFDRHDGIEVPKKFDAVVANPPYSQKWDTKTINREKDSRFKEFGVAPQSKADYAFVLHGLYHLDNKGTMAIVLPHGVLFRGAAEGKIRKNLIDNNLLDAVIGLPANLFYGTSIPTCVLVFKGREARKNTDILFIDASSEFEKGKNQNKLTEENINKIINAYIKRENIEKFSHVASLEEIKVNDYNLNIPRYVDTFEEAEVIPLSVISEELKSIDEEINKTEVELLNMLKDLEGSTPETQQELDALLKYFTK